MIRQIFSAAVVVFGLIANAVMPSVSVASDTSADLRSAVLSHGANVIFIRHALAPGFGDPAHFDIKDCSTQRNLDATGRQQARDLGDMMRKTELTFTSVLSSRWCRCQDTASAMKIGAFQTYDGLNSFFQDHVDREETLRLLNKRLSTLAPNDLEVMITHQVVISAITGISPRSGGLVLYNTKTGQAERFNP